MNKYLLIAVVLLGTLIAYSRSQYSDSSSSESDSSSSNEYDVDVDPPKHGDIPAIDFNFAELLEQLKEDIREYVATLKVVGGNKKEKARITNNFVDRVLAEFRMIADRDLDPLPLPDFDQGFDYSLLIFTASGHMQLTEGKAYNLSTINREGSVRITGVGNKISVTVPLNFKELPFTFHYSAKLLEIGPTGYIEGNVQRLKSRLKLTLDTEKKRFTRAKFEITNTGLVTFDYKGNSIIDTALYILKRVFSVFVDVAIKILFHSYINERLDDLVSDINDALNEALGPNY